MKRAARRRTVYMRRRFFVSFLVFLFSLSFAFSVLAEYLGPDRVTVQFVTVRDPDNDVWTLTHVDPFDPYSDVCLIVHTCDQHPSVDRQLALCGWVADDSGCSMAYKTEEQTVSLPEATISESLQNCDLNNDWCTSSPTLSLTANEPLPGESIILIEGTRNGEAFACVSGTCDVPLEEGNNNFSFWALSSYGDGSQMGTLSAQVDTVPPRSAFSSPPEGSTIWVSGTLNMSGSSSDASSGVASAEISLDGGGSWESLSLTGGGWSYSWDTSGVPDGMYVVLVRTSDVAGHLESTARINVNVDRTPASANLPDEWMIWEPIAIGGSDAGSGVDVAMLTIHGGSYGNREYTWSGGSLPGAFVWDRLFGSIVAPIGNYKVTLEVWDKLGNSSSDSGTVIIPAPPTPSPTPSSSPIPPADAPESNTPATTPSSTPDSGEGVLSVSSTATDEPSEIFASSGPAAAPADGSAVTTGPTGPDIGLSESSGSSNLLWGGAALAAAAAATAYALSRRKAREAYIAKMRAQIAAESSKVARVRRLRSLWNRAVARALPLRNALLGTIAAGAAAAAEITARAVSNGDKHSPPPIAELEEPIPSETDLSVTEGQQADLLLEEGNVAYPVPPSVKDLLPGFSFTPHTYRKPVLSFLNQEFGIHSNFKIGAEASPTTAMSFDGINYRLGRTGVNAGWNGDRIGVSFRTPNIQKTLPDGVIFSANQSGSISFNWDGWNSRLDIEYYSNSFRYSTQGVPGPSGAGSEGMYYTNKPVQGLVVIGVGVVVITTAVVFGPRGVEALRQLGQQLPIPIPVPVP